MSFAAARASLRDGDLTQAIALLRALTGDMAARVADEVERLVWSRAARVVDSVHVEEASLARDADLVFFVRGGGEELVGRKLLSSLFVDGGIDELFCGRITSSMILGVPLGVRTSDRDVRAQARLLAADDAARRFARITIAADAEIMFPFARMLGSERLEPRAADVGWTVDDEVEQKLAVGEAAQSEWLLEELTRAGLTANAVVFDPACSTGRVLAAIKERFPSVKTIGQDLSAAMLERARMRVDVVACEDARRPMVAPASVDALVLRFLNADVVTTHDARRLLAALVPTLKPGARLFAYGHTPLRVERLDFEIHALDVEKCVARTKDGAALQAYACVKPRNDGFTT